MARRIAALIVAVAALGSVPALASPAAHAAGSLEVTTIDRHGRVVAAPLRAVRLKDGAGFTLRGGHVRRLPFGRYDVLVDIVDRSDLSATVAVRRVVVDGAETLTVDARRGRLVAPVLKPAPGPGFMPTTGLEVCIGGNSELSAWPDEFPLYAVPSHLREVSLGLNASWVPAGYSPPGPQYVAALGYTGGIPDRIAPTIRQSALATLTVRGRSGYLTGQHLLQLRGSDGTCRGAAARAEAYPTIPYSVTFHVSPGRWGATQDGDDAIVESAYRAGHRYGLSLDRAVKGPSTRLPSTDSYSHELVLSSIQMFTSSNSIFGLDQSASYRITHGRHVLFDRRHLRNDISIQPRLPGAGWYTLTASARRLVDGAPARGLSTASSLRMHFFADPDRNHQIRDYVARFVPAGLNTANAASGPRTVVTVLPERPRPDSQDVQRWRDAVKSVRAWYSYDGHTWHAVRVAHAGGRWRATVPNPASGYVSLRARIDDTHGDWSTASVTRAYAVG